MPEPAMQEDGNGFERKAARLGRHV
jgi:hypothetical protein